jgi:drug/metabolite transporter (DMT)-like permease
LNSQQATSGVGSIVLLVAGLIAGWLASKGIITTPDIPEWTAALGTVIGLIGSSILIFFKMQSHTADAIITAASQTPGVVNVVTTPAIANSDAHADNAKVVSSVKSQ